MRIELIQVCSSGDLHDFDLNIDIEPVTVLHPHDEALGTAILNAIIGLDDVYCGEIKIDGVMHQELMQQEALPRLFGYVFDKGIMLSNLSLRENLLLPYRMIKDDSADDNFDEEVMSLLDRFELKINLDMRPAYVKQSVIKILGLIRVLLFEPKLLLLDDPYYLLNQAQRRIMLRELIGLQQKHHMLISSSDDDFTGGFCPSVIKI